MAANRQHVRIRLRFSRDYHEPSWYFVDLSKTKTIRDLCQVISERFSRKNSSYFKLTMRNFLLPAWESTEILENGDVINVQIEDSAPSDAKPELNSSSNGQPVLNVDDQSKTECPPLEDHEAERKSPKKKKKKKKSKKTPMKELDFDNNMTQKVSPILVYSAGKDVNKKRSEELINVEELVKRNYYKTTGSTSSSSAPNKNTKDKNPVLSSNVEENRNATSHLFIANKIHSTGTNKQIVTKEGTENQKSGIEGTTPVSGKNTKPEDKIYDEEVNKNGTKLDGSNNQFKASKSPECLENDNVEIDTSNPDKQKRRRRRKRKRQDIDGTNISVSNSSTINSAVYDALSIFRTNLPTTKQHKIFDSDIEEVNDEHEQTDVFTPESFVGENKPLNYVRESTLSNGTVVYKRNRKRKGVELSKYDQLNSVLTTASQIIQNPTISDKTQETAKVPKLENSELAPLVGPPRTGDRIAYKMLEMSENYTPVVSQYQEGVVKSYDPVSNCITLKQELSEKSFTQTGLGKFDLDVIEDQEIVLTNREQPSDEISVNWSLVLEPKLLN